VLSSDVEGSGVEIWKGWSSNASHVSFASIVSVEVSIVPTGHALTCRADAELDCRAVAELDCRADAELDCRADQ